ncbi:YceD family protein [Salibacterium aidingense]|uniref:YceD family protein n=1 Tax=Salibacterium aidingense TaxID=384933 RepID=UPI0003F5DA53|nr:YceD family protein [Salibacterium aidingense]
MRWSIQQLLAKKEEGLEMDASVDVRELIERDREIRDISPVQVSGRGDFTGDTVTFHVRLKGSMVLPCSRTLADVNYPFDIPMTESFRLDGTPVDEEDIHLHEPENGYVDLLPYIEENILVELPIQVFADNVSDHDSPAPQHGKDWEVITTEEAAGKNQEEEEKVDPRMADLAKYFDK